MRVHFCVIILLPSECVIILAVKMRDNFGCHIYSWAIILLLSKFAIIFGSRMGSSHLSDMLAASHISLSLRCRKFRIPWRCAEYGNAERSYAAPLRGIFISSTSATSGQTLYWVTTFCRLLSPKSHCLPNVFPLHQYQYTGPLTCLRFPSSCSRPCDYPGRPSASPVLKLAAFVVETI